MKQVRHKNNIINDTSKEPKMVTLWNEYEIYLAELKAEEETEEPTQ